MEGQNKWARPSYNEDNGKFATDRDDYGTSDEVIFKITFKVKEQSKENLTVTLNEVAGSNGKDEVKLNNIKTDITVKNGISNPDNPKPEEPNTNTSTDNTNTTNNNTVNNDKNNNTNNNANNNIANTSNNTTTNSNKSNNNTNVKNNNIVNTNSSDNVKNGIFPKAGASSIVFGLIGILIIIAAIFYVRIRIIDSKAKKNNIIK